LLWSITRQSQSASSRVRLFIRSATRSSSILNDSSIRVRSAGGNIWCSLFPLPASINRILKKTSFHCVKALVNLKRTGRDQSRPNDIRLIMLKSFHNARKLSDRKAVYCIKGQSTAYCYHLGGRRQSKAPTPCSSQLSSSSTQGTWVQPSGILAKEHDSMNDFMKLKDCSAHVRDILRGIDEGDTSVSKLSNRIGELPLHELRQLGRELQRRAMEGSDAANANERIAIVRTAVSRILDTA
jgi:hypothetical protein